jgi:hypothetical protein
MFGTVGTRDRITAQGVLVELVRNPTKGFLSHHGAQAETGVEMITIPELVSQALGSFLTSETRPVWLFACRLD